jgi:hypothetical protein
MCLMYQCETEICIHNATKLYVNTGLEMGSRAREPMGDILEASVDPTYSIGRVQPVIFSNSQTWGQSSQIFASAPAHIV